MEKRRCIRALTLADRFGRRFQSVNLAKLAVQFVRSSSTAPIAIHASPPHHVFTGRHCPAVAKRTPVPVNVERNTMSANQKGGSKQSSNQGGVQGGTPEQHAEAGRQSHKNDTSRQSGNAGSGGSGTGGASGGRSASSGSGSGTRGGTPEQHAEAGRQSHKNDGKK
jgi:hypothetical protein